MVAVVSTDRLSAVWSALLNAFLGRKAVKTVDACALYWGVVVKVNGAKLDVMLDSKDIASPTGIPLLVGISGALTLTGGERVLVGFRNGDPSQPYVFGIEQGTSAQETTIAASLLFLGKKSGSQLVALDGDAVNCGTLTLTVVMGVLGGSYTDGLGNTTPVTSGTPLVIRGRIGSSATQVYAI